jgi:hypothetical protein
MDNMNRENMGQRYCALIIGILFAVIGLAGFVPGLVSLPPTGAAIPVDTSPNIYSAGFGYLFGLFPTNLLHNIVHIVVGSVGIVAYSSSGGARLYNRGFAIAYALIAIMGLLACRSNNVRLNADFREHCLVQRPNSHRRCLLWVCPTDTNNATDEHAAQILRED